MYLQKTKINVQFSHANKPKKIVKLLPKADIAPIADNMDHIVQFGDQLSGARHATRNTSEKILQCRDINFVPYTDAPPP